MSLTFVAMTQALDRQAHALGDEAGEDVAEIAGGNGERDRAVRAAERDGGREVVDDLGDDPGPVDGVDAGQSEAVAEGVVVEHRLHQGLAVVERTFHRNGVDVGRRDGRHLPALDLRDAAVRVEDDDVDPVEPAKGLDRSAAGIARGRADDRRTAPALGQHMVHEPGEELHGDVLERQGRPVEQLLDEEVIAELDERCDGRMREGAVRLLEHAAQGFGLDLPLDERRDDRLGDMPIGLSGETGDVFAAELWPCLRKIEPAIAGKTREERIAKPKDRGVAPCRDIAQGGRPS